jgi:hypothetical protein
MPKKPDVTNPSPARFLTIFGGNWMKTVQTRLDGQATRGLILAIKIMDVTTVFCYILSALFTKYSL